MKKVVAVIGFMSTFGVFAAEWCENFPGFGGESERFAEYILGNRMGCVMDGETSYKISKCWANQDVIYRRFGNSFLKTRIERSRFIVKFKAVSCLDKKTKSRRDFKFVRVQQKYDKSKGHYMVIKAKEKGRVKGYRKVCDTHNDFCNRLIPIFRP